MLALAFASETAIGAGEEHTKALPELNKNELHVDLKGLCEGV